MAGTGSVGITVNQSYPQAQPSSNNTVRVVKAVFTSRKGPDYPMLIDPTQSIPLYGDPRGADATNFSGPNLLNMLASQVPTPRKYSLQILACRVGVTRAAANVSDGSTVPFVVQGIGPYAGSAGNTLQVVFSAPQIQVIETRQGSVGLAETQTITFYHLGGSPTGSTTLSFNGVVAGAGITPASLVSGSGAANLQAYLQGITSIGAGNVAVTNLGSPTTGAFAFGLQFTGALASGNQPLVAVSATTLAGGTGTIPVQSVVANDVSGGGSVQKFILQAGQNPFSTAQQIYFAINNNQLIQNPNSVLQCTTLATNALMPIAQTLTLTGGSDGQNTTGTDGSIANALAQSLNVGKADYVVAGFDAKTVGPAVLAHVQAGLAVNHFMKFWGGPSMGTTNATLNAGAYNIFNTSRCVLFGQDNYAALNNANLNLNYPVDGFYLAAAECSRKAQMPEELNLYDDTPNGFQSVPPVPPDIGAPLTEAQLQATQDAGFTMMRVSPNTGRLAIRDLITTAPATDQFGQPNLFLYASMQDGFDLIAKTCVSFIGSSLLAQPASAPDGVKAQVVAVLNAALQSLVNVVANGFQVQATYDPFQNIVIANIGYGGRPPLNTFIINIAAIPGFTGAS